MQYPFLDVGFEYCSFQNEIDAAYQSVIDSDYFIGGDPVSKFVAEFTEYCGAKYCVGMASGLDAIGFPLRAYAPVN